MTRDDAENGHRTRLFLAWMLAVAVVLVIAGYGYNYYTLGATERPFSPKHEILRPSGTIGIRLGMLGVLMFFLIYLYPLRKNGAGSEGRGIPATGWISTSCSGPPLRSSSRFILRLNSATSPAWPSGAC